ncbi:hypothetical protein EDB85DRAFT_1889775 [Lactarius pseudohatsudake]|nr:hypothetical protein EDB85DRAFT_1889775 [Lactarius pseudohatsudake]
MDPLVGRPDETGDEAYGRAHLTGLLHVRERRPALVQCGKGLGSSFDELIPRGVLTYIDRSIFWKQPTLLLVLTTPAAVIPVLGGGAELLVPTHALAGALVSVAQFARRPPLSVGRMTIDTDKIDNNGVNKGKAVVVLHTWKAPVGSRDKMRAAECLPVAAAAGDEVTGVAGDDGTVRVEEIIEKLTPEEVTVRLRAALPGLQALRTSLAALPNSAFLIPTTTFYTAHILPARPFSRAATTPVDIEHSSFKSLSAFLRASEKGGMLRLNDARPGVQVAAVFPTHADVIAHEPRRTVGEEDERRQRAEEREAQQAAEAANAGTTTTATELWKPHLGTLPLFGDLELDITALYPLAEVKSAVFAYVEKHDLANCFEQQFITIDSHAVFAALYGSPNAQATTPPLRNLQNPWYRITVLRGGSIVKKGALRPITVTAKARQGRRGKTCTHITGLDPFHLSADVLADALRLAVEVIVQGKQTLTRVVLELLESLGVSKKWIETAGIQDKKKTTYPHLPLQQFGEIVRLASRRAPRSLFDDRQDANVSWPHAVAIRDSTVGHGVLYEDRSMIRVVQDRECPELRRADTYRAPFDDIARAKAVVPATEEQVPVSTRGAQDRGVVRTGDRSVQERFVRDIPALAASDGRWTPLRAQRTLLPPCPVDIGSGRGRKRTGGPLPITPRAVLVRPSEPKAPVSRISGEPLRCGGIGEFKAWRHTSRYPKTWRGACTRRGRQQQSRFQQAEGTTSEERAYRSTLRQNRRNVPTSNHWGGWRNVQMVGTCVLTRLGALRGGRDGESCGDGVDVFGPSTGETHTFLGNGGGGGGGFALAVEGSPDGASLSRDKLYDLTPATQDCCEIRIARGHQIRTRRKTLDGKQDDAMTDLPRGADTAQTLGLPGRQLAISPPLSQSESFFVAPCLVLVTAFARIKGRIGS